MGLDQSGVITVGTLVPKEGGHTLLHNTLLVIPPVISWGISASQKLLGGSVQDLSELQDPKALGYLLIFGSYLKPIAYC